MLLTNEGVFHRFLGQRPDGFIDGRGIRWAASTDTYKAWVAYWTRLAQTGASVGALTTRRGDDSYFLEFGGERLLGGVTDPAALADELFDALVEREPERVGLNVEQLSERELSNLGIHDRVARDVKWRCRRRVAPTTRSPSTTGTTTEPSRQGSGR